MQEQSNIIITISESVSDVSKTTIVEAKIRDPECLIKNILEHVNLADRVEYKLDEKSMEDIIKHP